MGDKVTGWQGGGSETPSDAGTSDAGVAPTSGFRTPTSDPSSSRLLDSSTSRLAIPILIVGAGPTGLTLAIELARRGVPLRLIDRDPQRPRTSRAIGTQLRTVEVFRLMGIPESALQPAAQPRALRFAEGERTVARIALNDSAPDAPRLISMDESDT